MAHFYQREYLEDDLRRWFEGSAVFSQEQQAAGFVIGIDFDDGIINFNLENPHHSDEAWWDHDVETSFEQYGAVQCGNTALFFSRMPNRQYSFGLKQRQFVIEHLPGMPLRGPLNMLEAVEQFHNRTIYTLPNAMQLLSEGEKRSCVLSEDVRLMRVYERQGPDPIYMLVWRNNIVGFVEEGDVRIEEQYAPFQQLIMQDVAA